MSAKNILGKRLLDLLEKHDMTQRDLAKKINASDITISRYVRGLQLPRIDIIKAMADILGVTADYLLGNDDIQDIVEESELVKVPVFKTLTAKDSIDNPDTKLILKYLNVPRVDYTDRNRLFAKVINTDHMTPRIMRGDIVLFETIFIGRDKIDDGDVCLVCKGDEEAVIREMVHSDNGGYFFNMFNVGMPPRFYTADDMRKNNVQIIGRALKLIHDFKPRTDK